MHDLPTTLVVMALQAESAGVFESAAVPVLYCGVGKVNAALTLSRELSNYELRGRVAPLVINFGTAGSHVHATGAYVACDEFVQRDMDASALGFALGETPYDTAPARLAFAPRFAGLPRGVCGSGDSFATASTAMACDVLDMEAYAFAKVCRAYGASFACVKYVTDGADHAAAASWQDNVHKAAQRFLDLYRSMNIERKDRRESV